ncbi:hypothetical protein CRG98_022734 [Punica granatum]|uniref:Late embryogenesis abundant protein LEA-2 subgroup domain-containing protein n=1 Tax=Punica granatum TaxID=22663 RepID=A0A2I0JKT3_PUNGR|nr:hypothetical protein CRG98_022734 [Punica granatum]
MAESYHNQEYPLAPAGIDGHPRSDAESLNDKEEKRRKRIKWAIYISVFAVFQVIVIVVFSLVVMRVQRPKFRVGTLRIQALTTGAQGNLTLSSSGRMNGKVELMLIFKKKKSTDMNCTMTIAVASRTVQSLTCK